MDIHEADTLPEILATPKPPLKPSHKGNDKIFILVLIVWIIYISLSLGMIIGRFFLVGIK